MIRVDMEKCTGCRRCETACAFFHTGKVSNRLARIKVMHQYGTGIDGPVVCVQCEERFCMCCPVDALSIGPLGQVVHSPTICILCGSCENLCPIGAIELFDEFVYVCDLCGGRPQCVEACTEGALTYDPDGERPSLAAFTTAKKMNPSEKRWNYITIMGLPTREKWRESHG
jgi:Fe-S-cluster-containing hydrogenase component 2